MGYIDDIDTNSPLAADDPGDFPAEMRAFKGHIKSSFPNVSGEVTCTESDFNTVDVATLGTAEASKVVTTNATKDVAGLNDVTMTGTLSGATLADGTVATTQSADDDSTKVATTAYADAAVSALVVGKVLQVAYETTYTDVNCTTSYQTRDTITLTDVLAGSRVIILGIARFDAISGTSSVSVQLTDNSDTLITAGAEGMFSSVSTGYSTTIPIVGSEVPGAGTHTYKFKFASNQNNTAEIGHTTLVALEIAA